MIVCALISTLIGECDILAAAIRWKDRALPRMLRAFLETRFSVDACFRCPCPSQSLIGCVGLLSRDENVSLSKISDAERGLDSGGSRDSCKVDRSKSGQLRLEPRDDGCC